VVVRADSPQAWQLLQIGGSSHAELTWTELPRDAVDPLDRVNSGDADYAIVDANEFEFARHLYPEARVAFTLPNAPGAMGGARGRVRIWRGAESNSSPALASVGRARHASSATPAPNRATSTILKRSPVPELISAARLPQLQPLFEEAARSTGLTGGCWLPSATRNPSGRARRAPPMVRAAS
jgi:hypothetical protein